MTATEHEVDRSIRALTKEEQTIYSGACVAAVAKIPAFRDGISLLRPFYDGTAQTAYTDMYSRVGLSPLFFNELNSSQRATFILHEVMHVLNNHFARGDALGEKNGQILNISGDFEINSGLMTLPNLDPWEMIMPDKDPFDFPLNLSMEKYYHLLKQEQKKQQNQAGDGQGEGQGEGGEGGASGESQGQGQGQGSSGPGSGGTCSGNCQQGQAGEAASDTVCTCPQDKKNKGKQPGAHCDKSTEERSAAADAAGVSRASQAEQNIAKKNTIARVREERNAAKAAGKGHMANFLSLVEMRMNPPKVSWQSIFRKAVAKSTDSLVKGRTDYSYRRVNRRMANSELVFPGMTKYIPTVMFGIDTSGSMDMVDYKALLSEAEGILRQNAKGNDSVKIFSVDTEVEGMQEVRKVKDIKLKGGGGTDMDAALRHVNSMSKKERPDIFVLATDGGVFSWAGYEQLLKDAKKSYVHILLITTKSGYQGVPASLKRLCTVIDISSDDV